MPSRRSSRDMSDSDDSDDDLLRPVFGGSRASKRKIARDEAAKKKKRMDQMNALLSNGRIKLEQENRMDKISEENKNLKEDDDLGDETKTTSTDKGNAAGHTNGSSSASSFAQQYEPKDSRETFCLGSRNTLKFSRHIPAQQTTKESCSSDTNEKESCVFAPFWSGFEEALTDLRTILVAEKQKQETPSSSVALREELLRLCSASSPHACRTYLKKALLSKKKDQDQIRRIDVNVLRWLITMACGPVSDSSNDDQKTKQSTTKKRRPRTTTAVDSHKVSQKLLMDAQWGAFQTLYRLWSNGLGFPSQKYNQGAIYLLSIRALPRQLCQWFGSSFSFEDTTAEKGNSETTEDIEAKTAQITNSQITLVRFLELWALALQKQNDDHDPQENVHLVQFHHSENRSEFRKDVSDAIMAVLWAGLNPSFASSISARNDGTRAIQTIVACLLDRVRRECTSYQSGIDENMESFGEWMERLSEKIVTTWSTQLGRGRKGTDAYLDEEAWLSSARSVTLLVRIDGSSGGLNAHDDIEKRIVSTLREFQLSLFRSILIRAFVGQNGLKEQNVENSSDEKCIPNDEKPFDWISSLMKEETERMKIPVGIQSSQRWRAMVLAVTGLVKLASSFPEDTPSKCFALMDICTVCFQSAIVELEPEIRKNLPDEKVADFDDEDDILASNDTASSSLNDEVLEKHALYNALVRIENASQLISNQTKAIIMRNVCFSWTGSMAEILRNYVSSQKEQYAPPSVTSEVATKQQSTINSFFESNKTSLELTSN